MRRNRRNRIIWMVILGIIALATLFPMLWMASSSFKLQGEIYQDPPTWIPQQFTLKNYEDLFGRFHFGILTRNSVIISLATVAISMIFGVMAAYGFSRYPFPGSNVVLGALLLTRMITPSSLVVPLFTIMQNLGRLNKLDSIIVGVAVLNLPFVVWIMKPFFDEIPRDIEEAGELDGLSLVRVFWKVALPMAAPGLFTTFLFSFIAGWTELLLGITFSTIPEAMPLTAGLMQMQTGYQIYWGPMMAGGIYLSIPTFIIAFALQKYLVKGLRAGY
jgi:ABC-type glycerol-3-phosphate transport system permease component